MDFSTPRGHRPEFRHAQHWSERQWSDFIWNAESELLEIRADLERLEAGDSPLLRAARADLSDRRRHLNELLREARERRAALRGQRSTTASGATSGDLLERLEAAQRALAATREHIRATRERSKNAFGADRAS